MVLQASFLSPHVALKPPQLTCASHLVPVQTPAEECYRALCASFCVCPSAGVRCLWAAFIVASLVFFSRHGISRTRARLMPQVGGGRRQTSGRGRALCFPSRSTWVLIVAVTCTAHHGVGGDNTALMVWTVRVRGPRATLATSGTCARSGVRVRKGGKQPVGEPGVESACGTRSTRLGRTTPGVERRVRTKASVGR